jgi:drug/metabolite transporter (DMT)-like permease
MSNHANKRSAERTGELFILAGVWVWGLFPVLTKLTLNSVPPIFSLATATLFSCVLFGAIVLATGQTKHLFVKEAYRPILLATIINGVGYYLLVFSGVALTSAGNSGIILQMEVFFSFLILTLLGQERFNRDHSIGAIFMISGAVLALIPALILTTDWRIIKGDLLITMGCAIAPIGNIYTRKARALVPSSVILLVRSLVAGPILLAIALCLEEVPSHGAFSASLVVVILNGIFSMGISKLFWAEAIHRISIPKAISLTSFSPAVTLILAYFALGETPSWYQVLSILPIMFGVFMLTRPARAA